MASNLLIDRCNELMQSHRSRGSRLLLHRGFVRAVVGVPFFLFLCLLSWWCSTTILVALITSCHPTLARGMCLWCFACTRSVDFVLSMPISDWRTVPRVMSLLFSDCWQNRYWSWGSQFSRLEHSSLSFTAFGIVKQNLGWVCAFDVSLLWGKAICLCHIPCMDCWLAASGGCQQLRHGW